MTHQLPSFAYSDQTRQTLRLAQQEAAAYFQPQIGTEHLLLGLLQTPNADVAQVLAGLGVTITRAREAVDLVAGYGVTKKSAPSTLTLVSQRTRDVLQRAADHAQAAAEPTIEPRHLLLALLDVPGSAALGVLQAVGIEQDHLRQLVLATIPDNTGSLTHLDARGQARMVDVGSKHVTQREAIARGSVLMQPTTLSQIVAGDLPKGDVLATARIAGIMAAKRTSELIPLCHPLMLTHVSLELTPDLDRNAVLIEATVRTTGQTGVEMEALTAVSIAALTLYDMCKAIDRAMRISDVRLAEKRGGRSGEMVLE